MLGVVDKHKASKSKKAAVPRIAGLTPEESRRAHKFFNTFDRDGNKTIDRWELRLCLEATGQNPTDAHIEELMLQLDDNKSGSLDFQEFARAIQLQKANETVSDHESDMLAAFVALGGGSDKSGEVQCSIIRKVIKDDFGLTLKIDELMDDLDRNKDGTVTFDEFLTLFS